MECTRIWLRNWDFQRRLLEKEQCKSCPFCVRHSYLTWYMSLPYIIKLSETVWELWPANYFCFKKDNYITKKVRVVSLACHRHTGPPLHPYQILSNYLKQYGSYGLHNYIMKKVRVLISSTQHAYFSSFSFLLNIIKICLSVSKLWSVQGCIYVFLLQGR